MDYHSDQLVYLWRGEIALTSRFAQDFALENSLKFILKETFSLEVLILFGEGGRRFGGRDNLEKFRGKDTYWACSFVDVIMFFDKI